MAWVTWRQHRFALAGVAALFGLAATYLLLTGLRMHHAYAAVAACHPAGKGICQQLAGSFLNTYAPGAGPVLGLLQVIPAPARPGGGPGQSRGWLDYATVQTVVRLTSLPSSRRRPGTS